MKTDPVPIKVKRKLLEKDIEKAVCDYARKQNWYVRKFSSPNRRSVPDRIFLNPGGLVLFIEFKRPGGKLTPAQRREREEIMKHNGYCYKVENIDQGKFIIDTWQNVVLKNPYAQL